MAAYPEKIDLHMHTTISDGTDDPAQILVNVKNAGINMFSVTDHDAIEGCRMIAGLLKEEDPLFLYGVEFSCKDEKGRYHILGYDYDLEGESINKVVDTGHGFRMEKAARRLEILKKDYNYTFSDEDVDALMKMHNPGKPHIANLMIKYGYAETVEGAIKGCLNKIKTPSDYIRPHQAIEGILASGGIPVLAHPTYGNGDDLILGEEMNERLQYLIDMGLEGVEAFYSGFTDKIISEVLTFADRYDLYVTAGSDYHGGNKLVHLSDTNLETTKDAPEGLCRFLDKVLKDR